MTLDDISICRRQMSRSSLLSFPQVVAFIYYSKFLIIWIQIVNTRIQKFIEQIFNNWTIRVGNYCLEIII